MVGSTQCLCECVLCVSVCEHRCIYTQTQPQPTVASETAFCPHSSDSVRGQQQVQDVVPGPHLSPVSSWDLVVLRRGPGQESVPPVS